MAVPAVSIVKHFDIVEDIGFSEIASFVDTSAAAEKAESGVYIEVVIPTWEIPQGGEFLFKGTGASFGMPNRTWDGWLKEMAAKKK